MEQVSRIYARAGAIVVSAMLAQGGCSSGKLFRKELVFTHDELQKRVEKEFPLKRKKSLLKVEFSDPAVLLEEGSSRIGIRLSIRCRLAGLTSFSGVMEADGQIEYRPETGRFAIANGRLTNVDLNDVPKKYEETIEAVAAAVATTHLSTFTVYELKQDDFKQSLARLVLKSVSVEDGAVVVEVGL